MKKILVAIAVVTFLAVAVGATAQMPPPPPPAAGGPGPGAGPGPGQTPPPEAVLKNVLGFTDEQLGALKTLGDARQNAVEPLHKQIATSEKALGDLLKTEKPDVAQVGTLVVQIHGLRKQVAQAEETFRTGFANLLTATQKQKVEEIQGLQAALMAGEVLRHIGAF